MKTVNQLLGMLLCAAFFSGCYTSTKTQFARGPKPEVTISATHAAIRDAVLADMVRSGYALSEENSHMLRFHKSAEGQGAMGVAYLSSTVTGFGKRKDAVRTVTYTFVNAQEGIAVSVSSVLSGDGMQQEMTGDPAVFNEYMAQLQTIKQRLEVTPALAPKT